MIIPGDATSLLSSFLESSILDAKTASLISFTLAQLWCQFLSTSFQGNSLGWIFNKNYSEKSSLMNRKIRARSSCRQHQLYFMSSSWFHKQLNSFKSLVFCWLECHVFQKRHSTFGDNGEIKGKKFSQPSCLSVTFKMKLFSPEIETFQNRKRSQLSVSPFSP